MSRRAEEERVAELLASLREPEVLPPPADVAYWRARARLALREERRRRAGALRPLRALHLVLGLGALATAVILLSFSPAIGLYAAPLTFAAVALGAQLLSETAAGRLR